MMKQHNHPDYVCKLCGKPVPPQEIRWYANKKGGRKYPKVYHLSCARELGRTRHRTRYSKTGRTRVLKADRDAYAAEGKKWCAQCQTARPRHEFAKCATSADGKMGWCRFCTSKVTKERRHDRLGIPARVHISLEDKWAYERQGLKYCPSCQQARPYEEFKNSPTAKSPHRAVCRECNAARTLGNGITGHALRAKREANNGACEVCGARRGLVVDHDHSVYGDASLRGVICGATCNLVLGYMQDSVQLLERLAEYVQSHRDFLRRASSQKSEIIEVHQKKGQITRSLHAQLKAEGRKWCPDCRKDYPTKEFGASQNVCRMCMSARKKGGGVTGDAVRRMWEKRGAKCNVCDRVEKLRLDHDHNMSGDPSLRGVLCIHCNSALGRLKDSVPHILLLRNYLLKWRAARGDVC